MPTPEFLADWYQRYDVLGEHDPYYAAMQNADPFTTPEGLEVAYQFALVKRTCEATRDSMRILDVGSGPGLFLDLTRRAGWQGIGVELHARAAQTSSKRFGIDVRAGTIESIDLPLASFDAVTLWDIFEHVPDPLSLLRRSAELLKPGGLLFIETPNGSSLLDRAVIVFAKLGLRGPAITFYGVHHLTLWNRATICRALSIAGFRVIEIRSASTPARRIFRGTSFRDRAMRCGVSMIQRLSTLFGMQNKMLIVAQRRPAVLSDSTDKVSPPQI